VPVYLSFATTDYHRMDFVVETLLQSLTSPDYGSLTDDDLAMLRKGWESSSNAAALDKTRARGRPTSHFAAPSRAVGSERGETSAANS
jgi:hypothetical protein